MISSMDMLFNRIWDNECILKRRREGVVVNILKNGDKADPRRY